MVVVTTQNNLSNLKIIKGQENSHSNLPIVIIGSIELRCSSGGKPISLSWPVVHLVPKQSSQEQMGKRSLILCMNNPFIVESIRVFICGNWFKNFKLSNFLRMSTAALTHQHCGLNFSSIFLTQLRVLVLILQIYSMVVLINLTYHNVVALIVGSLRATVMRATALIYFQIFMIISFFPLNLPKCSRFIRFINMQSSKRIKP